MVDDNLTTSEFCRRYRVGLRTALRWRFTGEGPRWFRAGPRKVLYRREDCEVWAAARTFAEIGLAPQPPKQPDPPDDLHAA